MQREVKEGALFSGIQELTEAVVIYENLNHQKYWKRDIRSLDVARKKGIKRKLNSKLGCYSVTFSCIKGGKKFISTSKGHRQTRTFRDDCPSQIHAVATSDGEFLLITKFIGTHNHDTSEELFSLLPQSRKLKENDVKLVLDYMDVQANKKLVKDVIQLKTGKAIRLKDIDNIVGSSEIRGSDSLMNAATLLENYGSDCQVLTNSDEFRAVEHKFISNAAMREEFEFYPEYIGVDGTYKLLKIRAPLFIFHIIETVFNFFSLSSVTKIKFCLSTNNSIQ